MFMPSFRGGGAEKVFVNLANYFSMTHEVILSVCDDNGPNKSSLNSNVKLINYEKERVFSALVSHYFCIKQYKPDVVFSNTVSCNGVSLMVKLLISSPSFLIREANLRVKKTTLKSRVRDLFSYNLYRFANGIIFNSPDTKRSIISSGMVKVSSIVVGNPVITKLPAVQYRQSDVGSTIRITCVGRLSEQKNFSLAIKVLKLFRDRDYDAKLDIYGIGSQYNTLSDLVVSLNIEQHVNFHGYVTDLDLIYAESDVFLLTSHYEGFGNVIVEALAYGVPVVATNSKGGVDYILNSEDYGEVREFSENALYESILQQIETNSEVKFVRRRSRALEFSTDEIGNKYQAYLEKISKK